jgi:hypothetical protein
MNSNHNNVVFQRYRSVSPFQTDYKPSTTRKDLFGTGYSGSSAWAQPVDSLSESTGNSQPGPPLPEARCGTGYEGSNAWAVQRESSGFDPTFSFTKTGTGSNGSNAGPNCGSSNLIPALSSIFLGLAALALSLGKRVTILDSFTNLEESSPCLRVGIWRTRLL